MCHYCGNFQKNILILYKDIPGFLKLNEQPLYMLICMNLVVKLTRINPISVLLSESVLAGSQIREVWDQCNIDTKSELVDIYIFIDIGP